MGDLRLTPGRQCQDLIELLDTKSVSGELENYWCCEIPRVILLFTCNTNSSIEKTDPL